MKYILLLIHDGRSTYGESNGVFVPLRAIFHALLKLTKYRTNIEQGFPTPLEVFGEARSSQQKPKGRKPPPIGSNGGTPSGSPHIQQRASSNSTHQQQQQYYQAPPPPMHPQQRTQVLQHQRPYIPPQQLLPPPQQLLPQLVPVLSQQQFIQPVPSQRHSSQLSLNSTHSNQYRSTSGHQVPQQFVPRSKEEVFSSIDRNNTGSVSFPELSLALLNRDGSKFTIKASASIFKLFDSDESQSLSYNEFSRLFDCLDRWKNCFVMADKNKSNSLSFSEFQEALQVLGYRLSTDTALYVFQTFSGVNLELKFDQFIESCVYLISITRVFKKFDPQENGVAVIQFENFVEEVLKLKTKS